MEERYHVYINDDGEVTIDTELPGGKESLYSTHYLEGAIAFKRFRTRLNYIEGKDEEERGE